ncbi:hypothetical protein AAZX31_06G284200 [Glycine max]|uniref:Uncharacterized protein n=1 Tax=Glycine max TaxID=3847 RepID=A0A0R0JND3_SOYBN|nr:putative UPF0481 protein At3g02645 [Glycine max]KAH1128259.1 hypothetical protein GYH30_016714 [Glycine max]KRH56109.1 hypothetical protein GLYMA_06G304100v4 [Glycine max]|eukprot:XP_014632312.1 putative UPF0481 protein At3g02645 isoform X1 [Glycine max]
MAYSGDVVRINVAEMLEGAREPVTTECCIYKVPFSIRRHNEEAYTPKVVSIGPFHHRHPRLQDMQKHKLFYSMAFLQRTQTTSDSFIGKIEEMEPEFRRCYSHTLEFSKEQLVKIIFVDCAFILELFYRFGSGEWKEDMYLSKPLTRRSMRYDLLLLENQVPFFVLERLFNLSFSSQGDDFPSFLEFTFHFFGWFNRSSLNFNNINRIRHFTDLIRTFLLQDPLPSRIDGKMIKHLPSVTELSEAGLRFKVLESESCLLKFDFSGRVLEIPQLVVEDGTETLFRNMVALEQCHCPEESYITDYVGFLDFLVNTNRDVDILVQERVFLNWLGDTDSVATMINGLMKDIATPNNTSSQYFDVSEKLNAFHKNPWRKLKSTLRRDYCRGPWQTAASSAAIILLVLSFVQTVCSILQVIHQ